jgi:cholesterol transport system auxiliary component
MNRTLPRLFTVAVAGLTLALGGCISLLPKTKPAELYRFGQPGSPEAITAPQGQVGVFRTNSTFQRESAGDQLLTVTDGKIAYIARTRWAAPAAVLWDQAVLAAFDSDPGRVRLISRGEPASAAYILRLDVRNFEARYEHGPKAAPTIVVRVRAAMTQSGKTPAVAERIFEKQVTAADNRVSAIVPAYDRAVAEVLKDIVAWTNDLAKPT